MLVQHIRKFIKELGESKSPIPCDKKFVTILSERFSHRDDPETLTHDDIQFILQCFRERWIADTDTDYLINPSAVNQIWIKFAHELEPFSEKNYLQILLPHITNQVDFNNLTPLSETVRLENFYLGYDSKTLYRKRGLCEHLLDNQFELSTCRTLSIKKFEPFTIEELTRLYRSSQSKAEFSISEERFDNFWDFLKKKVFPRMQSKGQVPLEILPQLFGLIENYYSLKTSHADIQFFKMEVQKFFKALYQFDLESINFLYGTKIPYQGRDYYLLELLISINMMQSYDVDEQIEAIAGWMFQFNPRLKSARKELIPFYHELKAVNLQENSVASNRDNLLYRVKTLLVSLLVVPFEIFPFSGKVISLWDIKNTVFSEAQEIYNQFAPYLISNRVEELLSVYNKVLKESIKHSQKDKDIYTWLTHYKSTLDWYQLVEVGDLSKMDVYWFEPELLLHVLSHLKVVNKSLNAKIVNFLDELIHTCSQNNNELLIQLRVNILFTKFLKSLNEQQKRNLILTLQMFDQVDAKNKFLANCIDYVANRLLYISTYLTETSNNFFGAYRSIESKKLFINKADVKQVSDILESFKEILHSLKESYKGEQLENMLIYLRKISRPILTVAEVEEAQQSARTLDYIGSPT